MAKSETVIYKGIRFRRYPESKNWADRVYYTPGIADRKRGVKRLHVEIWKDRNKREVPEGFHVHHHNENPLNNTPGNLVLISAEAHHDHHFTPERHAVFMDNLELGRAAAAAWHRSEEGRMFHVKLGKQSWEGRELKAFPCQQCGESCECLRRGEHVKFCSNKCRAAARRASGVDDVERQCAGCGEPFTVNKHAKTTCCSKKCAWTVRKLEA
jgi:hypothetical protein